MSQRIVIPQDLTITDLITAVQAYSTTADLDLLRLAYDFAADAHKGQFRKTGEPYIIHPLSTAYILARMRIDPNIVIAGLLHDVPEDTPITLEMIEKNFNHDIAAMVGGITKLGAIKYRGVERYIENLRKMFVAMAEDIRVMIIKFADRCHNLMTLDAHEPKKRIRIALESLEIYAPIANRLGMNEFKEMLEDLSFRHVLPAEHSRVLALRKTILTQEGVYVDQVIATLKEELSKAGIQLRAVYGREKQLYSLYQKLVRKNWDMNQIYDVIAIRLIVNTVSDCYAALGLIHDRFPPMKGRIKDYIAQPKPNGYKSLHTTVHCDDLHVVEFQIRTQEINDEAEYGIAAHWHYDERGSRLPARDIAWAKELAEIQKEILNNLSDLESMKVDFFRNRIFVFTPKGDVIDLPEEATAVDFAYHIHSEIGNKCTGAKVNDQLVSLDTLLKNGDVVEILIDKNRKGPSPDWIKFVKTNHAKAHIKSSLNTHTKTWLRSIIPNKNQKNG